MECAHVQVDDWIVVKTDEYEYICAESKKGKGKD
jgi:hypothetical protein